MASSIDNIIVWAAEENEQRKLMESLKPYVKKVTLEEFETWSYEALQPEFKRSSKGAITKPWVEAVFDRLSAEIETRKEVLLKAEIIPLEVILERCSADREIATMSRGRLAVFLGNQIIKTLSDRFTLLDKSQIKSLESDAQALIGWARYLPDAPENDVAQKRLQTACALANARSQAESVRKVLDPKKPMPDLLAIKMVGDCKPN